MALYLPLDAVTGSSMDVDVASDFLELGAYFAPDAAVRTSDLANAASLGAAEDHAGLQREMEEGEEEIVSAAVERIDSRRLVLGSAYPFALDVGGDVLTCQLEPHSFAQATYILSLVLSHLRAASPVLDRSGFHPEDDEVRRLRTHFQYCATAALAAEVHGDAWSFGSPRPDGSAFLEKLEQIWRRLGDGYVQAQIGAPQQPKDDRVDVFAARQHPDRLPGFPLAAAQVATGANWRGKSLKGHLSAFRSRWFRTQPVTDFLAYMIVPFASVDEQFVDDVREMGNVLHRLRVPRRVAEAGRLLEAGVTIEGYDRLADVSRWAVDYRKRAGAAA
jgi:hypothetical protein